MNNFQLVNFDGDGACLFRAVCYSDAGNDSNHSVLHTAAMNYIRDNASFFEEFSDINPDENITFKDYLTKISHLAQQVREFVLYVLANVICKPIMVYYSDCPPRIYCPATVNELSNKVSILYRDTLLSNSGHYMALVKSAKQTKRTSSYEDFSDNAPCQCY